MKLTIVGTGFVGLATAVVFADWGHQVTGLDIDADKIEQLNTGHAPFHEAELNKLIAVHLKSKKLSFSTVYKEALADSQAVFICVGTPSRPDGSIDLKYIEASLREVIATVDPGAVIVVKSTVPPAIEAIYHQLYASLKIGKKLHFATNPEFLVEGKAIHDTRCPDRVVIGTESEVARRCLKKIYSSVKAPIVCTNIATAQLVKYASNSLLSLKISFINELARLSDQVGSDITQVVKILSLDPRISSGHMQAGLGFGGSCFPKDTAALIALGANYGLDFNLLKAARHVNHTQIQYITGKIQSVLPNIGQKITILGAAFKPDTDDIRDSKALELAINLQSLGYQVIVHDPLVKPTSLKPFNILLTNHIKKAVKDSAAVIIATEWPKYQKLDWDKLKKSMKIPNLIDARNLLDRQTMESLGFNYQGVGR